MDVEKRIQSLSESVALHDAQMAEIRAYSVSIEQSLSKFGDILGGLLQVAEKHAEEIAAHWELLREHERVMRQRDAESRQRDAELDERIRQLVSAIGAMIQQRPN